MRHSCALWNPSGRVPDGRDHPGPRGDCVVALRDAVLGGSTVLWFRAVASGTLDWCGSHLEDQEKLALAVRAALGRWVLSEPDLPVPAGSTPQRQWADG